MPARIPVNLPPLRAKIQKSFSLLIIPYALLGTFMMISVFLAIGVTPKALHMNYDSIEVSVQMRDAWDALKNPALFPAHPQKDWIQQFDRALAFENENITEPGEDLLAKNISLLWNTAKLAPAKLSNADTLKMHGLLTQLIEINQKGMFRFAEENNLFGRKVFWSSVLFFLMTLGLSVFLGDGLADRLARPLKEMAEILKEGTPVGERLKLPAPTSLEMRILTLELTSLWNRLSDFRKLNVEALAAQTEKLETVLASVEDAILVLDNQNTVLHCSDGMIKLLDLSFVEVVGHRWEDLSSTSENYQKLRSLFQPTMDADNAVELRSGEKKLTYAGRCRTIRTKNGTDIGQLYLLHDITESRHRERLRAEFIGVLSHELKTPLQSLGTAAELLVARKSQVSDELKLLFETVEEDVGRIKAVANDFVQVGLTEHHALKLKLERQLINKHLQEWLKPFHVLARDKRVKLAFEQEGSREVWGDFDAVKLPWAISNLLANAIRVSQAGQTITVRLDDRVSTEYYQIDILDEGPGIPETVQKRMFEPYYQAPQGTLGASAGFLGLGLTIAKEVVEAHEGTLEYFPNKPHGSIFRIQLPSTAVCS